MTGRGQPRRPAGNPVDRARALGDELVRIHDSLRTDLKRIRREIDSYSGDIGTRPTELRAHCAAFCLALTKHHTSEDATAFPILREEFGELAPLLDQLEQDHHMVADIVRRVQRLLEELTPENTERMKGELDGLAAILESHFQWEERRLVEAFNALDEASRPTEDFFGIPAPR
ncbi:hemerythrin domain-containing protein [Micromonospora sp. NPDC002296]|uniref:hemerythrin domain-containing protein n=1 Tax=Micromonospora sp. NPDC002296 TaxID=3154271 RepID=UPI00332BFBD5